MLRKKNTLSSNNFKTKQRIYEKVLNVCKTQQMIFHSKLRWSIGCIVRRTKSGLVWILLLTFQENTAHVTKKKKKQWEREGERDRERKRERKREVEEVRGA